MLSKGRFLDFEFVWERQGIHKPFEKAIDISIKAVRRFMLDHYPNPADWREKFKMKGLWENDISKIDLDLSADVLDEISVKKPRKQTRKRPVKKLKWLMEWKQQFLLLMFLLNTGEYY